MAKAPQEERTGGVRAGAKRYIGRRMMGDSLGAGTSFIRKSAQGLSVIPDVGGIRKYWRGPATEAEGRKLFGQHIRPAYKDDENIDDSARGLRMMAILIVIIGLIVGVAAIIIDDRFFKMGGLFAFFMLGIQGTILFHRAEQLNQRRMFGLRELF